MKLYTLEKEKTGLLIIDAQERLMSAMLRKYFVSDNIAKLIHLANLFKLPILLTEQNPRFLGSTLPEIKTLIPSINPIEKLYFDCCAVDTFNQVLNKLNLNAIILTGVETHVCVLQTCLSLLHKGFTVHVPNDAVDSRTEDNRLTALNLMNEAGAVITSAEIVIFQALKQAGTDAFRQMLKVVK
jgi:nicotinamidase-related amidase